MYSVSNSETINNVTCPLVVIKKKTKFYDKFIVTNLLK